MESMVGVLVGPTLLPGYSLPGPAVMHDIVTAELREGCALEKVSKIVASTKDNWRVHMSPRTTPEALSRRLYRLLECFPNATAFGPLDGSFRDSRTTVRRGES